MTKIQAVLENIDACEEARDWCEAQHQSAAYLWRHCKKPQWMFFLMAALKHPKYIEVIEYLGFICDDYLFYRSVGNGNAHSRGCAASEFCVFSTTRDQWESEANKIREIIPEWDWSKS